MDLRDYLDVLRTRWKLVVTCTLLGVIAAGLASLLATPMYTSTTKVFVNAADSQSNVGTAYTGSLYTQQIVKSLVDVVNSQRVTQAIVDDLHLDRTASQVSAQISATNPLDTVIVEISVTDPNPRVAQAIATAAATQFTAAAKEYTQPGVTDNALVTVNVVQPANLPTTPSSPRTKINLALGFLVGLAIGVGAAVLLETLDTRIKSVEGLSKYFAAPLLAVIAYDSDAAKHPLITQTSGHSARAEAMRQLRTNLQFVDVDHRPRSIVVASSIPREGKTTTAVNLAITLAQTGEQVILVEADMRRPKVADYLGIEGNAGVTDVLIGRAKLEDVLQPWGRTGNFWVLASGPLPPNPSELVASHAMGELVKQLEERAFVIIDVPPLLPVTDGAVVAQYTGGALLVVASSKVRREQLRTAEENLAKAGGRLLGHVFNMASLRGPDAYRYGYSYRYETPGRGGGKSAGKGKGTGGRERLDPNDVLAVPLVRANGTPVDTDRSARQPAGASVARPVPAVAAQTVVPHGSGPRASVAKSAAVVSPTTAASAVAEAEPSVRVVHVEVPNDVAGAERAGQHQPADEPVVRPAENGHASASPPTAHAGRLQDLLGVYHHHDSGGAGAAALDEPELATVDVDEAPVDWKPPTPKPAFDPLTAPLDELPGWHQN